MRDKDIRTAMLLGDEGVDRLRASRVAVFGLGGVGSYAVEALVRAGVGAIDLIDKDKVSVSNINRQIIADTSTVGIDKTTVQRDRILLIDPDCRVTCHRMFYLPDSASALPLDVYDYIIDAVDTVTGKLTIITGAKAADVPVISCMGTGNKLDPTAFRVADIYETKVCPLARIMRKECKARGIESLKVVYSEEPPLHGRPSGEVPDPGRRDIPGSVSFVPAAAGLAAAGEVIRYLAFTERQLI